MAEITCRCLNVTVHLDNKADLGQSVQPADLLITVKHVSTFEKLHKVQLDLAGITVVHDCLVQQYQSGDWIVHRCSNCNTDTHVTHLVKGNGKVYLTEKMETNTAKIEELKRSEQFSTMFKVILKEVPKDEVERFERLRVSSMSFGTRDPVMKGIHQQMKIHLNEEETAMEERILRYEKQQRGAFSNLRAKAHQERGLLFRSIAMCRASALSEAAVDEMNKKPSIKQDVMEAANHGEPMTDRSHQPLSGTSSYSSSLGVPPVTITLQDKPPVAGSKDPTGYLPKQDSLEDELFGIDGFDQNVPFQSDDEDSVGTDDSYHEEFTLPSASINVAHSLPMSVPLFRTGVQLKQTDQTDEKVHIAPNQMADSIKALALGIHQETEMFGDLPKPRTNSTTWAR